MTSILNRLVTGDGMRKSRFHDYHGNAIDLRGLWYLPHSVASALGLRLFRVRSAIPWLGYRAVHHIDSLLDRGSTVLEYGSGMSTLWFARRAGRVVSIETDSTWFSMIRSRLEAEQCMNVQYLYSPVDQVAMQDKVGDSSFDFVLVDGLTRDVVMEAAVRKAKPGGYVYLDNSDVPYPEHKRARQTLLDAAGPEQDIRIFRDFCPGQVSVTGVTVLRRRFDGISRSDVPFLAV